MMNFDDKIDYYNSMLLNDRAILYHDDNKLKGMITYFIDDMCNRDRYVYREPWTYIEDNADGDMCYIDQMITDKDNKHVNHLHCFKELKEHILSRFNNVTTITWNRYKGGTVNVHSKRIG